VSEAVALTDPEVIPIVVVPWVNVVAIPFVPVALLIVATFASEDVQWPVTLRSCVDPSV
jgi:hypothetical protein